jgi:toxin ParE1/3/4
MTSSGVALVLRDDAEDDIREAYDYYERAFPGLGSDFLLSIDAILSRIQRNPHIFQIIYKNVRRGLLDRFPFGVFYFVEKERIIVIGVLHCMRDPLHWRGRT